MIGENRAIQASPDPNPLSAADLAAFVATFETGSVHGAADALNLTQSAVTKRLQALERRAGVELLVRGRFGARPSAAGRLLYPEAKEALAALQRAQEAIEGHRDLTARALSLAASHTIGEVLLPGWLASFWREHPEIRAQVEIINSREVLRALEEGERQIGFVEGPGEPPDLDSLVVQRDHILVVVAAGHRWSSRREVHPQELRQEPYLTREPGSGTRAFADEALRRVGIELTPQIEAASVQSIKRALAGGGFALLSSLAIQPEVRAGSLRALKLAGASLQRRLHAVRGPATQRSEVARAFWSWLERGPAAAAGGRGAG